jgi:O-antigen/teichoic acid export membrane protein
MPESRAAPHDPVDGQVPLARGAFLGFRADVVTAVSALAVAVVVARALGDEGRGVFFLVTLSATLISLIADLGMSAMAIAFSARRRLPAPELHGLAVLFSVAAGLAGAAVLLPFEGFWTGEVLRGLDAELLALLCIGVVPLLYANIVAATITGLGRIPAITKLRIGQAVALLVLITAAVLVEPTAEAAVLGWLATTSLYASALGAYLWHYSGHPVRPHAQTIREALGFGTRGWIGNLAHQGFLRVDVLFLSARYGPATVGVYSLASVAAEKVSLLGQAAYGASAAALGGRAQADAATLAANLVRLLLTLMAPAAALLALLAFPLFPVVFGDEFADAALPFALLLPGTVALTLWYVVSLYIVSTLHRPGTTTVIQGSALLVSLPLYYLAVREWEMTGAAVVSSIVYLSVFLMGVVVLLRSSATRAVDLLPRRSDPALLVTLARSALDRSHG